MECSVEGCPSRVLARSWCAKHYDRWRRWGDPLGARTQPGPCKEDGCESITVGQGWCRAHYEEFVKNPKRRAAAADRAVLAQQVRGDRLCAFEECRSPLDPARASVYCGKPCKEGQRRVEGRASVANLKSYYLRKYGLTLEQVEQMRAAGCRICGSKGGTGRHGQLHIDHCHDTGKVRGVLCHGCNLALGYFRSDPDLLRAAIAYLEAAAAA